MSESFLLGGNLPNTAGITPASRGQERKEPRIVLSLVKEAGGHMNMGIPGRSFALFGGCQVD